MDSWKSSAEARMQEVLTTRTVYFNRNFNRENTKVLVNPYFKHSVHINPNFGSNVYVNPSILQSNYQTKPPTKNYPVQLPVKVSRFSKINKTTTQTTTNYHRNTTFVHVPVKSHPEKTSKGNLQIPILNNPVVKKPLETKLVVNPATKNPVIPKPRVHNYTLVKPTINANLKHSQVVYKNLQKINNLPKQESKLKRDFTSTNIKLIKCEPPKSSPRHTNCNVITKYKLFKKSPPTNNVVNSKYKLVRVNGENKKRLSLSPRKIINNKFKIDNRASKAKLKQNAKAYLMNFDPQRQIIKRAQYRKKMDVKKLPKLVKINGITYRFSAKQDMLHKVTRSTKFDASKVKKKIVINGITYVQKDLLTYVRKYANNLVKINSKVLKKDNNPCLVFRKTGKCALHAKGKCIKQHNPKQISICIRFLQGACYNKSCLLSHNVSSEKMPTCKYFLEGCCRNDDCQYLHVKLSKNADICKDFLEGYCMNGVQCMKKHQFLCPVFEKTGNCSKRCCPYPHGEAVRQYTDKILNKIARSTFNSSKKTSNLIKPDAKAEPDPSHRYYKEEMASGIKKKSDVNLETDTDDEESGYVRKPKLGELPSFIGFED